MELQTSLAGILLEHPLMNAAGTCKTLEDVRVLARSVSAAIVVGSITLQPREGNHGNVYSAEPTYSLNSLGLPNRGAEYYRDTLPEMVAVAHGAGKPLFVSVAGFTADEYMVLAELAFIGGADLVELNLGCPNVWQGSTQKRIASFAPAFVDQILLCVAERVGVDAKISLKISPFSDPSALIELALVIGNSNVPKAVVAVNTFPNAFGYTDQQTPSITAGSGLAGLAGPAMKPIGLGQVRSFRALLPEHIQMVGVGGITRGRDVLEYQTSGAVATQVATAYLEQGARVFSILLEELVEVAEAPSAPEDQ